MGFYHILWVLLLLFKSQVSDAKQCKCLPSDSCWPNSTEWSTFQSQLSRPILHLQPLAAPCFQSSPSFNAAACQSVQSNYFISQYRVDQVAAHQYPNFEEVVNQTRVFGCDLESSSSPDSTCFQGRVPTIAINVTTVADVQRTLAFARAHNLKIRVKNTGHEFAGRSMGPSSVMIWMHNMQDIVFHSSFVPDGQSYKSYKNAATVGAGVIFKQYYDAANAHNRTVIGGLGGHASVGASGGWPLGAGHSVLSPLYGLGVDNVLQFQVVLPNTTLVTANAYHNPDLFWALKGGGGPSFGILISTTYQTHDILPLTAAFYNATVSSPAARLNLIDRWLQSHVNVADQHWSGFWSYDNSSLSINLVNLKSGSQNPLVQFASASSKIPGVNATAFTFKKYPSFYQWHQENFIENADINDAGIGVLTGSWLIPRQTLSSNNTTALAKAIAGTPSGQPYLVGGGAVSTGDPKSASINPAWRSMLLDFIPVSLISNVSSANEIDSAKRIIHNQLNIMKKIAPNGGSYVNEPDLLEEQWQKGYWGNNYPRLLALKKQIDPDDLLIVFKGVNSEGWDDEGLCRV